MSSYSEYLVRENLRRTKILDTRPHRDAGHQTEIVKRLAASGTQETLNPAVACLSVLNAPGTDAPGLPGNKYYNGKRHEVKDTSLYNLYTAGQAVAQSSMAVNAKTSQINLLCLSNEVIREKQDTLELYPQEALKQQAVNNIRNCCKKCGATFDAAVCGCVNRVPTQPDIIGRR